MGVNFSRKQDYSILGYKTSNPMIADSVDQFINHVMEVTEETLKKEFGFRGNKILRFRRAFDKVKQDVEFDK